MKNTGLTTDLTFGYDVNNRLTNMVDAYSGPNAATSFTYDSAGGLLTENGPLAGTPDPDLLTYTRNTARLRTGLTLNQPGGGTFALTYVHDLARRLQSVYGPASFWYTYRPVSVGSDSYASRLVEQTDLPNSLRIANSYLDGAGVPDPLARLRRTEFRDNTGAVKNSHAYLLNQGSQRTQHVRGGNGHPYSATSDYTYDDNGQLETSSAESLAYGYDAGWNMATRVQGGSSTTYAVNDLNQVTGIGGLSAGYDAHGNRTSQVYDSNGPKTYTYTYDDENQLTAAQTDSYYTPEASRWKTEFVYDGLNRLRFRKEYNWQYGGWYGPMSQTRCLYDGMLVVHERNPTAPTVSYVRGLDLSGTLQGAGGIGGLLARARRATSSPYAINGLSYYHADGNGNVTYLAGSTGAADAAYKYDPFGRTLASTGGYAAGNAYRFSSKAFHAPSGLYYYGYRFYDPNTQRWLNRDPIGEGEVLHLYQFASNEPMSQYDPLGLEVPWLGYPGLPPVPPRKPRVPPMPTSKPDPACLAGCEEDLATCYGSIRNILQAAGLTFASGVGNAAGEHITTPGKYYRWHGRWTLKAASVARGTGAGLATGAAIGLAVLHTECLSAYLGCRSGCPRVPLAY